MRTSPYGSLAGIYDRLVGAYAAPLVWKSFCFARERYGLHFRSVADIGCGTGTFLARLWFPGLTAYGIDRSAAMLEVARRKNRHTDTLFLCQDMRRLRLPRAVDLITCNQDTLNYLLRKDHLAVFFGRCARNITRFGHLVFDIIQAGRLHNPSPGEVIQKIQMPGVSALWRISWCPRRHLSRVRMTNCVKTAKDRRRIVHEDHRQRWYTQDEVEALLHAHGFELLGTHDMETLQTAMPWHQWVKYVARKTYL